MKKVKCNRIKLLKQESECGYFIEYFEFVFFKVFNNDGIDNIDTDHELKAQIHLDTWYRTGDFVAKEIRKELQKRGYDVINMNDLMKAIECRAFFCDYLYT